MQFYTSLVLIYLLYTVCILLAYTPHTLCIHSTYTPHILMMDNLAMRQFVNEPICQWGDGAIRQ